MQNYAIIMGYIANDRMFIALDCFLIELFITLIYPARILSCAGYFILS